LETSQRSQLIALQGMRVGRPVLDPADVEHRTVEVHLIPSQVAQLGGTQSVPEGHEDRGRVAMPVPTFLCSLDHGVDLGGSGATRRFTSVGAVELSSEFVNPGNPSETWAGRGLKPRWLAAALKTGKRLEDFSITAPVKRGRAAPKKARRK